MANFVDKLSKWVNETFMDTTIQRNFMGMYAVDTPIDGGGRNGVVDVYSKPIVQLSQQSERTLYERNALFDRIDLISNQWIAHTIKRILLSDGFNDLCGRKAVSILYRDEDDKEKSMMFNEAIQDMLKRTNLLDILTDCIANEGMEYAEIFLSTPVENGKGIIKVVDDLEVREHLALYKNAEFIGALKFELGSRGKISHRGFIKPEDISHFMVNYKKMPIKISKGFEKTYDIPEKIRCALPILTPVIDLILQYHQLEHISIALELIEATKPVLLGVGVNPDNDLGEITKQLQNYTNALNRNKNSIVNTLDTLDVSTILQYAMQIELVPFGVDDGTNLMKQIKTEYANSNLLDKMNDLRKNIALAVGIPEQYLSSIINGVTKDTKEDSLLTNPSYRGMLSKIQNTLGKGLRDCIYKHLKYKYTNKEGVLTRKVDKSKIEILFKSTTNLNDRLEKEEMLLNAETLGNLVNVIDNIASSPNIGLKVEDEEFHKLWKKQNNKYTEVRDIFRPLTPEEKQRMEAMQNVAMGDTINNMYGGQGTGSATENSMTDEKSTEKGEEVDIGKEMVQQDKVETQETPEQKVKSAESIKHTEIRNILK